MGTKSSSPTRDDLVLDAIQRTGFGVRDLLRHALGGVDPNNIVQRLVAGQKVESQKGALPQNRAYYLPYGEQTLGAVALAKRLALTWFTQAPSRFERVPMLRPELQRLFGDAAPSGSHVLQDGPADRPRVLLTYVPDTEHIGAGIMRVVERARSTPSIEEAMRAKNYGIAILVPWNSGFAPKIRKALAGFGEPGLQAITAENLGKETYVVVERVATPLTLTQALKEIR